MQPQHPILPTCCARTRENFLGDYQMIVVTLLAIVTYLAVAIVFLSAVEKRVSMTLPDLDSTILALFGLGQGAFD